MSSGEQNIWNFVIIDESTVTNAKSWKHTNVDKTQGENNRLLIQTKIIYGKIYHWLMKKFSVHKTLETKINTMPFQGKVSDSVAFEWKPRIYTIHQRGFLVSNCILGSCNLTTLIIQ